MDSQEARALLTEKLDEYRKRPYADLSGRVGGEDHFEVAGRSGAEYQIEVQFFWDDRPNADVRVIGSVDDGGLRAFVPLCRSFILSPDGKFVGEDIG